MQPNNTSARVKIMMNDKQMLSLFLNFVWEQSLANPAQEIEAYTQVMADEDDELMASVVVDSD
jgi:hypothetical protein